VSWVCGFEPSAAAHSDCLHYFLLVITRHSDHTVKGNPIAASFILIVRSNDRTHLNSDLSCAVNRSYPCALFPGAFIPTTADKGQFRFLTINVDDCVICPYPITLTTEKNIILAALLHIFRQQVMTPGTV